MTTAFRRIALVATLTRAVLVRLRIHTAPHLPRPAIFVANHRSVADVFVGLDFFRRLDRCPQVAVHARYFDQPGLRTLLERAGATPIGPGRGAQWFANAQGALNNGVCVALMPEGRLTPGSHSARGVSNLYSGAARLAIATGYPIIPIGASGTDDVWPVGRRLPAVRLRRTTVVLVVGEPISPDHANSRELTRLVEERLVALVSESRQRRSPSRRRPADQSSLA